MSAAMLLVWLFSLVAGVAQACITQTALDQRHAGSHAMAHCADASAARSADHHPAGSSKAACYKFCSEAAVPTPKSQPVQADTSTLPPPVLLALPAVWSFALAPVQTAFGSAPGTDGAARRPLPIPIAFLRLAL